MSGNKKSSQSNNNNSPYQGKRGGSGAKNSGGGSGGGKANARKKPRSKKRTPAEKAAARQTQEASVVTSAVPLAIVGIGCTFPKAGSVNEFWANVAGGVDAIGPIPETHWEISDYYDADKSAPDMTYAQRGGFMEPVEFDALEFGVSPNNIEATDTTQLMGLMCAKQTLADAGFETTPGAGDGKAFDRSRTSVILGVTGTLELVIPLGARLGHPIWRKALADAGVEGDVADDVVSRIADGYVPWQENSFPGLLGNVTAGRIANKFDLGGSNCVVDAACASSLSAIHMAAMELYTGRSDLAITGGVDTFNDIFMYMCFSKTPALSPTGDSRPFSAGADGTILGEGMGMVALKRLADAERDGDRVYAVIKGMGSSSDGAGNAVYAPSSEGQVRALKSAYTAAGVGAETIEMVEAHGTGTKVGDAVEIAALTEVYRDAKAEGTWCAVGSVKSMIGHTKAAAGVAGLVKCAMSLHHKVLAPTIKVDQPAEPVKPGEAPVYVNTVKRPWVARPGHPRRAAVSAFGFGGSNFHCVLEESRTPELKTLGGESDSDTKIENKQGVAADWDGDVTVFAWSGASEEALAESLNGFDANREWDELRGSAAVLRDAFDTKAACRLVMVTERGRGDLIKQVAGAKDLLVSQKGKARWSMPTGVFFGKGEKAGRLGVLFSGQGSQYVGMGRDLACRFEVVRESIEAANKVYGQGCGVGGSGRLSDFMYPISVFDDAAKSKQDEQLRDTAVAQPALGALSLGMWKLLQNMGVEASVFGGHSFGELPALCAGGRMSEESLHKLARLRGQLMGRGSGDRGSMLACAMTLEAVEGLLEEQGELEVVVANHNGPSQVVVSGATESIEKLEALLRERGERVKRLEVSAAFHSSFVAKATKGFKKELAGVEILEAAGGVEVYANSTGALYPTEAAEAKTMLGGQLGKRVRFVDEVNAMHEAGVQTFLEVGPGGTLAGLAGSILDGADCEVMSVDASNGGRRGTWDLAVVLGRLAALGYAVDLGAWDGGLAGTAKLLEEVAKKKKKRVTVTISGANYVKPKVPRKPTVKTKARTVVTTGSKQSIPAPANVAPSQGVEPSALNAQANAAVAAVQQSVLALGKMQEQTALLHRQYLEGQAASQQAIGQLIAQQQAMLGGAAPTAISMPVIATPVVAAPTPVAAPVIPVTPVIPTTPITPTPVPTPAPVIVEPVQTVEAVEAGGSSQASEVLLEVVAEKTGYPREMLDLDMSLDTDLGIDSIKRVEILSAMQEQMPDAPPVKAEDLGALETLGQIVEYLGANSPASAPAAPAQVESAPAASVDSNAAAEVLLEVVAEKTGYPREMLDLDMSLDTDLGIDSIKRVEILSAMQEQMPDAPPVKAEDLGALETLGQIVEYLGANSPTTSTVQVEAAAPTADVANVDSNKAAQVLLEVVADKTGYPLEMLELDMSLDTDLGIDSIKRVEILSAMQEQMPEAPPVKAEDLGALETLGQIVEYLGANAEPASATSTEPAATSTGNTSAALLTEVLLEVVADKTGYPLEMLELEMSLDTDLGIDSIKRVEILSAMQERLPEAPAVKAEDLGALSTLAEIINYMNSGAETTPEVKPLIAEGGESTATVGTVAPAIETREATIERQVPRIVKLENAGEDLGLAPGALIWVLDDGANLGAKVCDALNGRGYNAQLVDHKKQLGGGEELSGLLLMSAADFDGQHDTFNALKLMQTCSGPLQAAGQKGVAVLACVTLLDGQLGLGAGDIEAPLTGALAGLVKTASHEWENVNCKVIDANNEAATEIANEFLYAGPVEVGLKEGGRWGVQLVNEAVGAVQNDTVLGPDDAVVVTGGGRGVTAEVGIALAEAYGCTLVLLGRSAEPISEPAWLEGVEGEVAIKGAIMANGDGAMKPREVGDAYGKWMANRELARTLDRIEDTGARAIYRSVDVRDGEAVAAVIEGVREHAGAIRGLVHGAGVLADRLIEDKTQEQFDRVFGTKVDGLHAVLGALSEDALRVMVMFSSSTGRFGRKGQVDYAAANEVLNKVAQAEAKTRKECRVVSVNWGPWDGGMVTSALKEVFAAEGVGVIGLKSGSEYLAQEVGTAISGGAVEVVILGALEGAKGEEIAEPASPKYKVGAGSQNEKGGGGSLAFERELSLEGYPVLKSHVMKGKAVMPLALMVEWMAHGAVHGNPGMGFVGFDALKVFKAVTVGHDAGVSLAVYAGSAAYQDNGDAWVEVELRNVDSGAIHARGVMVLGTAVAAPGASTDATASGEYGSEPYGDGRLFHGADLQGIELVRNCDDAGIVADVKSAPGPGAWVKTPMRTSWLADPLALDSAFQAMILWSFAQKDAGSLPVGIGSYRQYVRAYPKDGVRVVARITKASANEAKASMEMLDHGGAVVAVLENYACVIDPSLAETFKQTQLAEGVGT